MNIFSHMDVFEAMMLICFGASWPFALIKTYKTKNVKGKSRLFLSLVILGYVFGVLHKIFYGVDIVIYLYLLNLILVATDLFFVFRYRKRIQNNTI